jgi:hypothetical protein
MSQAAATTERDISRRKKTLYVALTPSANYVVGGDTVNLTAAGGMTNPKNLPGGFPATLPKQVYVENSPAGYSAEWVPGTTLANGKLKIYTAPGTEMTAIAYNAALLADPFVLRLIGPIGNF